MTAKHKIAVAAAQLNLKELQEKGVLRVANPSAVAFKINIHTGVRVFVNENRDIILESPTLF